MFFNTGVAILVGHPARGSIKHALSTCVVFVILLLSCLCLCFGVGTEVLVAEGLQPGSVPALEAATPAAPQPSPAAADWLFSGVVELHSTLDS